MDLISRAVRNARASVRSVGEWGDSSIPPNSSLFTVDAANPVGEQGALAISTVASCVKVLHDDFGILPFDGYQGDRGGVRSMSPAQLPIVAQPFGPDVPRRVGFGQIVVSVAMRGKAFVRFTQRDRLGYPTQVQVLHPDKVQVSAPGGVKKFRINNTGPWLGTDEVGHIIGMSLPGMIDGLDPITMQRVTLGLAADVTQYGSSFFRNGGSPSGVISVKGPGDKKRAREVKENWEAGHGGVVNAHRPAVLFGGATWSQLSVTPDNAQFLQTRSFLREEICGWFGVPLQRIQAIVGNASQGGGNGLETIDAGYVTHTLLPIATAIEALWDTFIPGKTNTWSLFNFDGLLRASALTRAQIAQIHRLIGTRNRNELRAADGVGPIEGPDGSDYNVPFNTNSHVLPMTTDPGTELPPAAAPPMPGGPPTDGGQQQ